MPHPGEDPRTVPILRPLRADEARALQSFYEGLPDESQRLFRPLGWNAELARYADVCAANTAGTRFDLVLEADSRIVGWAFLQALDTETPVLGIGIAESHVGRGHGKRLMDALIGRARAAGKKAIALCHVAGNDRAHRLYVSCGFAVTSTFHGEDGLDYLKMRLTL